MNTNRKPHPVYRMYHFQWRWVTSDPDFKVTTFWGRISENRARLTDKVTIAQEETIQYNIWNVAMFGDLDWPLYASRGFVSISWASCFTICIIIAVDYKHLEKLHAVFTVRHYA